MGAAQKAPAPLPAKLAGLLREAKWLALVAAAAYLLLIFATFNRTDPGWSHSATEAAVRNAGTVFMGDWTPESLGDYCSGSNHVLPTGGAARAWSGLSVSSFMKSLTVQTASRAGLGGIGPCAVTLAVAEGLDAHARAVTIRLESLEPAK